ncbi:MAG: DUF3035 domain-containing protein [Pseudomonadota bacterium]
MAGLIMAFGLSACGNQSGLGRLVNDRAAIENDGPDEFAILPTRPLQAPPNYTELPEPELGARNRVDPLPEHDTVAALGGQPDRLDSTRVGPGEGALIAATSRNGSGGNIREVLAEEDAEVRRRNGPRFFERLFGTDTYFRTYDNQTLEARKEAARLRARGVKTPSVSPRSE